MVRGSVDFICGKAALEEGVERFCFGEAGEDAKIVGFIDSL